MTIIRTSENTKIVLPGEIQVATAFDEKPFLAANLNDTQLAVIARNSQKYVSGLAVYDLKEELDKCGEDLNAVMLAVFIDTTIFEMKLAQALSKFTKECELIPVIPKSSKFASKIATADEELENAYQEELHRYGLTFWVNWKPYYFYGYENLPIITNQGGLKETALNLDGNAFYLHAGNGSPVIVNPEELLTANSEIPAQLQ